jgi:hypothetical protein
MAIFHRQSLPFTRAQETFTGRDCSETVDKLALGSTYTSDPRPGFSYDRLELPLGDVLSAAQGNSLSLIVEASFAPGGGSEGAAAATALPEWVTERPVLLASGSPGPTMENATLHLVLQEAGGKATLEVEASQVGCCMLGPRDNPMRRCDSKETGLRSMPHENTTPVLSIASCYSF